MASVLRCERRECEANAFGRCRLIAVSLGKSGECEGYKVREEGA